MADVIKWFCVTRRYAIRLRRNLDRDTRIYGCKYIVHKCQTIVPVELRAHRVMCWSADINLALTLSLALYQIIYVKCNTCDQFTFDKNCTSLTMRMCASGRTLSLLSKKKHQEKFINKNGSLGERCTFNPFTNSVIATEIDENDRVCDWRAMKIRPELVTDANSFSKLIYSLWICHHEFRMNTRLTTLFFPRCSISLRFFRSIIITRTIKYLVFDWNRSDRDCECARKHAKTTTRIETIPFFSSHSISRRDKGAQRAINTWIFLYSYLLLLFVDNDIYYIRLYK